MAAQFVLSSQVVTQDTHCSSNNEQFVVEMPNARQRTKSYVVCGHFVGFEFEGIRYYD